MPAGFAYRIQQKLPQLGGDLGQLFFIQTAQILRAADGIE